MLETSANQVRGPSDTPLHSAPLEHKVREGPRQGDGLRPRLCMASVATRYFAERTVD
jgi:hypothetical protein